MAPRGRRPAGVDTRQAILDAARESFADKGYDATSLRGIARAAGVDPALVHHYFTGKDELFTRSMGLDALPAAPHVVVARILAAPREQVGETLMRTFLSVWDSPPGRDQIVGIFRAATTNEAAATTIREFLAREIFGRIALESGATDPDLAAGLAASQMVGLVMLRYVVGFPAMVAATPDQLIAEVGPTIQRYLTSGE